MNHLRYLPFLFLLPLSSLPGEPEYPEMREQVVLLEQRVAELERSVTLLLAAYQHQVRIEQEIKPHSCDMLDDRPDKEDINP